MNDLISEINFWNELLKRAFEKNKILNLMF